MKFDELRKSGAIKIETPRRKIIIRKSAPQQINPRFLKQTQAAKAWEEPAEIEQKIVQKFVMKPRKSLVTPPSVEENNTTASNSLTRPFGNSVKGLHRRFFSDVNQRDVFDEKSESEENDCPFGFAIDEIEEQQKEKEESPLKLTKQKSSDTLLQGKERYLVNMSRNNDNETGMKVNHLLRRSHVPVTS